MKTIVHFVFLVVLFSFICCSWRSTQLPELLRADSLMATSPESSLKLLQSMSLSELNDASSRAWYALLMTQARDKNYLIHTDDSLIRMAVDYYDMRGADVTLQAKSHYYLGRVYQDRREDPKAVREFLTAMPLAKEAKDEELLCILDGNLGYLFYQQSMYEQADSLYQQAERLAVQRNDSARLVVALSMLGDIGIAKGQSSYVSAENYLLRALAIAKDQQNVYLKRTVINSLSMLYSRMNNTDEALRFARLGLSLEVDSKDYSNYYLIQGMILSKKLQYDSATVYLKKSLLSDNYYVKTGAYMCLSDVNRKQGKVAEALQMEDYCNAYKDSVKRLEQPVEVMASVKDAMMRQTVQHYESFLHRYRYYVYVLGAALLCLALYLAYKRRRFRQEMNTLVQEHSTLQSHLSSQTEKLEMELRQKDLELTELYERYGQLGDTKEGADNQEAAILLMEQMKVVNKEKERLFREVLKESFIYRRLNALIETNYNNPDAMEKPTAADWEILKAEINRITIDFTGRLSRKYERLTDNDVCFCCLVKAGFKYSKIALLLCCTANAVYKRRLFIQGRMGVFSPEVTLESLIEEV
ncbi:hypothetical protein [Bacteroides sp.]|uniref:tetratricopeptide repeat protein n=1 Tax=Bacteroides sp. TaxID=29523 RepID=UPI002FCC7360